MRKLIVLILAAVSLTAFSQTIDLERKAIDITAEGKLLHRLEMAAWYGSDIFMDNFKEKDRIGGYFSYIDKNTSKCLFFSKDESPKVLGVVSFGDISLVETATIDFKERDFKDSEKDLYLIRTKALTEIREDSLFKTYSNSNLNLIPLLDNAGGKVYVLTGPKNAGVILFGNDYLLTFDKQDNLIDKQQIHRNLIPIRFDDEEKVDTSVHFHAPETGDFITPTDVCTLMLYAKFAKWKYHVVVSRDYASVWDCENEMLRIMTKEDFQKVEHEYFGEEGR
ncbi:hypothetical protein M2451_001584 [Dysgonomonas sp. PFB1-18]|uniref:hypothetical protein n=1 Tax=unclassified Dysgonomonas TaxID=2630389 RepID=UPI00247301D7|nr:MULTISPECIES: hypothetical protein [unclassified Dysgonomonas]MDH6308958.1 hypothetical protein [Dysgonomonas sp. PF1-14]MDH6338709.1 hypothetical protein [Dysgonomonas sp. PF1-16]MDH6380263.1 hypothetical protein [Dysgonomonas sp. PFB1-18]MDH6397593.1 hypothetical protein [Dysgonomonas sp. PF1-23]